MNWQLGLDLIPMEWIEIDSSRDSAAYDTTANHSQGIRLTL